MRERNWLASGLAHARTVSRCVQGSSRFQVGRCWRRWSALVPTLAAAGQVIGFVDFTNPFHPAWRLLRIGSHWNSLHQDLLDPFFAVFAFKFAVMTAVVVAVVSDQSFVVAGYMGANNAKNSVTSPSFFWLPHQVYNYRQLLNLGLLHTIIWGWFYNNWGLIHFFHTFTLWSKLEKVNLYWNQSERLGWWSFSH